MYGAGNIGRGFIGQLFYESGYETSFIDVAEPVINQLNTQHSYPVRILYGDSYKEEMIKNVDCVDGKDVNAVAKAIANADVMATAVGVNILKFIIGNIAEGLKLRWQDPSKAPLNIIICENLIGADKYLKNAIAEKLNDEEKKLLDEKVGFVEASIGRMVPVQTDEMKGDNPLRVCVECYGTLPVDKDAFKGEIPPPSSSLSRESSLYTTWAMPSVRTSVVLRVSITSGSLSAILMLSCLSCAQCSSRQ